MRLDQVVSKQRRNHLTVPMNYTTRLGMMRELLVNNEVESISYINSVEFYLLYWIIPRLLIASKRQTIAQAFRLNTSYYDTYDDTTYGLN